MPDGTECRGKRGEEDTSSQKTTLVIFGGAGDLAHRMLFPALYHLFLDHRLVEPFHIIAIDRPDLTVNELRGNVCEGIAEYSCRGPAEEEPWVTFASHVDYMKADITDPATYTKLADRIMKQHRLDRDEADIFYCAVPPSLYEPIIDGLSASGLSRDRGRSRIVLEKPIGYDLDSSLDIDRRLKAHFDECQVFRIDHFLGKETVQNILAFRFANSIFEPVWNRRYVDHVTITVAETLGVEHRGGYYDHTGSLRDMVQNHMLQVLCMIAMEPPVAFEPDEVRNKELDVLRAIRPIEPRHVSDVAVRGQYTHGWVKGEEVPGYREEPGVDPNSNTETFAALELHVDNWRWQGVPFYIRTGKRMFETVSEVTLAFREVPHQPFPEEAAEVWSTTMLTLGIQPTEGIAMRIQAREPGPRMRLTPVEMFFTYHDMFGPARIGAYETLLFDVMMGDATLFMRADQVEAAWRVIMPVLERWENTPPGPGFDYQAGTWGPLSSEDLIARDGHTWAEPTFVPLPEPYVRRENVAEKRERIEMR